MFDAIKITEKRVTLEWTEKDSNGAVTSVSLSSPERPRKGFLLALGAFKDYVMDLLGFPVEWDEGLTVTGLSLSRDKNGSLGLIVTAIRPVEKASGRPFVVNTPLMREAPEGQLVEHCLDDDILTLVRRAEAQAAKYQKGDREQADMFEADKTEGVEAPPPSEGDEAIAVAAAERAKRAGKSGRKRKPATQIPGVGDVANPEASEAVTTDAGLQALLARVGVDVPIDAITPRTSTERDAALRWAKGMEAVRGGRAKSGTQGGMPVWVEQYRTNAMPLASRATKADGAPPEAQAPPAAAGGADYMPASPKPH